MQKTRTFDMKLWPLLPCTLNFKLTEKTVYDDMLRFNA